MSNQESFSKAANIPPWIEFDNSSNKFRLTDKAFKSEENYQILSDYNHEWKLWNAAIDSMKVDRVASIIFNEHEEYTCMPVGREIFKLPANVEYDLFTYTPDATEFITVANRRLDFMIDNACWIQSTKTDAGGVAYQLWTQNEDEEFYTLHSSTEFFKTPRDAIDAAIEFSKA